MDKFFGNLHAVLAVSLVLAVGLMFAPYFNPPLGLWNGVFQWLHVFFGITWIGLLYYFNFVQIPTMASSDAAKLRDEVRALKDRVQVLERVITDSEASSLRLDREIEALRDKQNP